MIVNLTQHKATPEQIAAGVVDLKGSDYNMLKSALNFDVLPTTEEIKGRAQMIADLAVKSGCKSAMIGGALWLIEPLTKALRSQGIIPLFAFSMRDTIEEALPDGSVKKVAVFKHAGFVSAVD